MATNHSTSRSSSEQRALELLGTGLGPEVVANACGVSVSRVSQLLSDPEFAEEVAKLRFNSLQKHNKRDNEYDGIEDDLIAQFRTVMPMMMRPAEILKGIQVINAAKRRGQSAPEAINQSAQVVTIVMPTKIVQQFTTNIHNQVINAGEQQLITVQSGQMGKLAAEYVADSTSNAAGRQEAVQQVIQSRVKELLDTQTAKQAGTRIGVQSHERAREENTK